MLLPWNDVVEARHALEVGMGGLAGEGEGGPGEAGLEHPAAVAAQTPIAGRWQGGGFLNEEFIINNLF